MYHYIIHRYYNVPGYRYVIVWCVWDSYIVHRLLVWRHRVRRLTTDPGVMRSSLATYIYAFHIRLISTNKLYLLSWLSTYLYDKKVHIC